MRLLFVVQRYGERIAGGAEQLVRSFAERLVQRGHRVEVLTSCAESYTDWANAYRPGATDLAGVTVHRLAVDRLRENRLFGPLDGRVSWPARDAALSAVVSEAWSHRLGPELPDLEPWIDANVERFDAVVFSGYMFPTSLVGLPRAAAARPTVIQPAAHDEPYLRIPAVRRLFEHASGICALTEEELELVRRRFRPEGVTAVVGAGVPQPPPHDPEAGRRVRDRLGLGDRRFGISVGRIEPGKGTPELVDYFVESRARRDDDVALVLVGSNLANLAWRDGVIFADFVSDEDKWALLAEAEILFQPSYFESFSLSLAEGWRRGLPALVQGRCAVLEGQVRRSGGGLSYRSFAEFDAALGMLLDSAELRRDLGRAGQQYVERYDWDVVLGSFEDLVAASVDRWQVLDAATPHLRASARASH